MRLAEILREAWVDRFYKEFDELIHSETGTIQDVADKLTNEYKTFLILEPGYGKDMGGAATGKLADFPEEDLEKAPWIIELKQKGFESFIMMDSPYMMHMGTKLNEVPHLFWENLRHELTHIKQPDHLRRAGYKQGEKYTYVQPSDNPEENSANLLYMLQRIEKGPHALDIAGELAELKMTANDLRKFIKQETAAIMHAKKKEGHSPITGMTPELDNAIRETIKHSMLSFISRDQWDHALKIQGLLYHFLYYKFTRVYNLGGSKDEMRRIDNMMKSLLRTIEKNQKKIGGYQSKTRKPGQKYRSYGVAHPVGAVEDLMKRMGLGQDQS